jgi:phosphohistidine phosphatase
MHAYLVHHAEAVPAHLESQRPLSSRGLAQAAALAELARTRAVAPVLIWHSGKLRARQTAEAFLRTCSPFARFTMVRGLAPDDPPEWIRDALEGEEQDVLVAGHMPNIHRLSVLLGASDGCPLNGMVAMERTGPRRYVEAWRLSPPAVTGT